MQYYRHDAIMSRHIASYCNRNRNKHFFSQCGHVRRPSSGSIRVAILLLTTMSPKRKSSHIWQYFSEKLEPADQEDENSEEEISNSSTSNEPHNYSSTQERPTLFVWFRFFIHYIVILQSPI